MNVPTTRVISHGIPFNVDAANNAYAYDITPRIRIGDYDPTNELVTLTDGWQSLFDPKIAPYREACAAPRLRSEPTGQAKRSKRNIVPKKKESP